MNKFKQTAREILKETEAKRLNEDITILDSPEDKKALERVQTMPDLATILKDADLAGTIGGKNDDDDLEMWAEAVESAVMQILKYYDEMQTMAGDYAESEGHKSSEVQPDGNPYPKGTQKFKVGNNTYRHDPNWGNF